MKMRATEREKVGDRVKELVVGGEKRVGETEREDVRSQECKEDIKRWLEERRVEGRGKESGRRRNTRTSD